MQSNFSLLKVLLGFSSILITCLFDLNVNILNAQCCSYSILMSDSFGDGWDGSAVSAQVNGVTIATGTVVASSAAYTFEACTGDNITIFYTSGGGIWEGEISYFLTYNGTQLFNSGTNPLIGISYSGISDCDLEFEPSPTSCLGMDPICTADGLFFTASSNGGYAADLDPGNNYGCLFLTPNPTWYYLEIEDSGNIDMNLNAPQDIDYAIWGPFDDLDDAQGACGSLGQAPTSANGSLIDCSFSATADEYPSIPNGQDGEVYVMLITNYASVIQNITLDQIGGTGFTNCDIVCEQEPEYEVVEISCFNECDGGIIIEGTGLAPFDYSLENSIDNSVIAAVTDSSIEQTFSDLCAGQYIIYVTDSDDCTSEVSFQLDNPEDLTILTEELMGCYSVDYMGVTYIYSQTVVSSFLSVNGCDSIITAEITVIPVVTNVVNVSICNGETYTDGTSNYTATGIYEDFYTSALDCDSIVITNLVVSEPIVDVSIDSELPWMICVDEEITLDSSPTFFTEGTSLANFTWDFGDNTTDVLSWPVVTHSYSDAGAYFIQLFVVDDNGCNSGNAIDVLVEVSTAPSFEGTSVDLLSCLGSEVSLMGIVSPVEWITSPSSSFTPSIGTDCDSTFWTVGAGPIFTLEDCNDMVTEFTEVGEYLYTFHAVDNHGCEYTTDVNVEISELIASVEGDFSICPEQSISMNSSAEFNNSVLPNIIYEWIPGAFLTADDDVNPDVFDVTETTEYTFTAYPAGFPECASSTDITISLLDGPVAGINATEWCPGDQSLLSAVNFNLLDSVNWALENPDGSLLGLGNEPILIATEGGTFVLTAFGCGIQDTTTLPVQEISCDVFIPNIFTPNGDEFNNTFQIEGIEFQDNAHLVVYNRWGGIVFEDTKYDGLWDPEGGEVSGGTYFYVLTLESGETFDGTITILR
jgi:gliding motility-associated-like protein